MRRIEFFSIYDGASGGMLNLMKERFEHLKNKAELDINDIFELYHAKLYIDNGIFQNRWEEMKSRELIDSAKCN